VPMMTLAIRLIVVGAGFVSLVAGVLLLVV
jgi:hypothetical protein